MAATYRRPFSRSPAVRESEVHGLSQPEVTVAIKSDRLAELRLPASSIADALKLGGADVSSGAVVSGTRRYDVEAGGAFSRSTRSATCRCDRARGRSCAWAMSPMSSGARRKRGRACIAYNGKRAIWITANQKAGTDATKLRNALMQELESQKKVLPPDIDVVLQFDQSRDIAKRLAELARDFSIALALVMITLLPLGWRAAVVVMVSIPLSLASGLVAVYAMGFNLSQLVVAGFILSLGLLVNDSIVVIKNVSRHLRMGKARTLAAIEGTREISLAVMGSTGVLVFAFVPMLFLPEGAGNSR